MKSQWLSFVLLVVVISLHLSSPADASRILVLVFQQQSHVLVKHNIAIDLVRRGHDVFFLLPSGFSKADALRRDGINVLSYQQQPNVVYPFSTEFDEMMADSIFNRTRRDIFELSRLINGDCETILQDSELIHQMKSMEFDFALVEPFPMNPCHIIVPQVLRIPFASSTRGASPLTFRLPALPSFYITPYPGPEIRDLPKLDTLFARLMNALLVGLYRIFAIPLLWGNVTLLQKYTPEIQSWEQLMRQSEILLYESDHYIDNFLPLLPHVISIAGCGARPSKPLPDELEKVMESSGNAGVILASFGSVAYRMPVNMATKFLDAFGRLNETVLTRMAVPPGLKVPANVHMQSWLPQNDILGHPKTKLFMTHSGTNSQYEALYHAVPMLGIPMFADQGWNCVQARERGISLCLNLLEFTVEELYNNIRSVIDNATYRNSIRNLSERWREAAGDGCKKAGFWIDHVIKYGSAHLRSPALNQPLYQFLMLDVLGICILITSALILLAGLVARKCFLKIRGTFGKEKKE